MIVSTCYLRQDFKYKSLHLNRLYLVVSLLIISNFDFPLSNVKYFRRDHLHLFHISKYKFQRVTQFLVLFEIYNFCSDSLRNLYFRKSSMTFCKSTLYERTDIWRFCLISRRLNHNKIQTKMLNSLMLISLFVSPESA